MIRRGEFNTGRWYSDKGQRIVWVIIGTDLYFQDHDRFIEGKMDISADILNEEITEETSDARIQSRLMWLYDNGHYKWSGFEKDIIRPLLQLTPVTSYDLQQVNWRAWPEAVRNGTYIEFSCSEMLQLCTESTDLQFVTWVAHAMSHLRQGAIVFYRYRDSWGCRYGLEAGDYLSHLVTDR